jgi:hypothetical protein
MLQKWRRVSIRRIHYEKGSVGKSCTGLDLLSQGLELVSQGLDIVSQGLELASQGLELETNITMSFPSHRTFISRSESLILLVTRAWSSEPYLWSVTRQVDLLRTQCRFFLLILRNCPYMHTPDAVAAWTVYDCDFASSKYVLDPLGCVFVSLFGNDAQRWCWCFELRNDDDGSGGKCRPSGKPANISKRRHVRLPYCWSQHELKRCPHIRTVANHNVFTKWINLNRECKTSQHSKVGFSRNPRWA